MIKIFWFLLLIGNAVYSQTTVYDNSTLLTARDIGSLIKTFRKPGTDTIYALKIFGTDTSREARFDISNATTTMAKVTGLVLALEGKQATITTGTTAQYFRGDLSLATFPTTTAGFSNSTNKNFVTDAQLTVIGNTAGSNNGDNAANSLYSSLVSNATHTGDATGSTALTVVKINGVSLAGLGTGILKNTTGTGAPSIAVAGDFPTLNQNTSGTAAGLSSNIAESQVTNLVNDLALKSPLASPTFTGTVTLPNSTVTNAMLAGSIDLATKVTGIIPFASNAGTSAATSATTGTMTVSMVTKIITITPTNACTFNGSGGVTGQTSTFVITTSGVSSFTLTWGTNYKTTATLATGTVTAKIFAVTFLCTNGTQWIEISRTAAM